MSEAIKAVLGDELYTTVTTKLGDKKIDIISDSYIPKARFDEVNVSKNTLKTQVGELTSQIDALKKSSTGNEELQKTLTELQKKNGEWETKYNTTVLENAIKGEAVKEQAKDAQDILALINKANVKLDDSGKVSGLSEQLVELKKSKPYLFDIKEGTGTGKPPANNPAGGSKEDDKWAEMFKGLVHL